MPEFPEVSVIIPAFNEAAGIQACLLALQPLRPHCELIVADGGSDDDTVALATPLVDKVVAAVRGRAAQMNAAANQAAGVWLLFLHADTLLPVNALQEIRRARDGGQCWGRFDVRLDGQHPGLRVVAAMMNGRSRLTGITTGDQSLFVSGAAFRQVGGFPAIALMEDIAISKRLKRLGKPYCSRAKVKTSARRWECDGLLRTIWLMWRLRFSYFCGADPERLARQYYRST